MKRIILTIILIVSTSNADINDKIKEQCQKIINTDGKYKIPNDSYINGAVTGILTAVDKRYHRGQIIGKRDQIVVYACKEAFANENTSFKSAFTRGVQLTIDRRWTRFRKVK